MCFNVVAGGEKALFVTILAESHARMMLHIANLDFFDEKAIPRQIYYVSAFAALASEGLKGVLDVVRREIRNQESSLLVLDGLRAMQDRARSHEEYKRFIHELQVQCSLSGCTSVLLTSDVSQETTRPEHTMVDGLIVLRDVQDGQRRERRIEASKLRGISYLRGEHAFKITDAGLVIYPRLEALHARPSGEGATSTARLSTGVDELDQVMKGGYPLGSTTIVVGPPGTGKTTLGLHFLCKCSFEERGLYVSFFEPREQALKKADLFGLPLRRLVEEDHVRYLWFPLTENVLDEIGMAILKHAADLDARRVFIDGIGGFAYSTNAPERLLRFIAALVNELRAQERTVLYTHDRPELPAGVSAIIENFIELTVEHDDDALRRKLFVRKVRDSDFDPELRRYCVAGHGIEFLR